MIKLVLFGAGRIGKVHAATIHANEAVQLVGIVDVHEPSARALAEKYGAKVMSEEEVFQDKSIPAILICSATNTHADLIEKAAKSGKAIFCEKPIDLSLARVQECLSVVKENKAQLFVGFNRRFDKNFRAVKAALDAGEIGKAELLQISSRDPGPPPIDYIKVSGGLYRDMMIHDFDMACWLMNDTPVAVSASGSAIVDKAIGEAGDVDTAIVTLEFASGALAVITNSRRASYGYDQRIEVHGELGMLQAENVAESTLVKSTAEGVSSQKPLYFFLERYQEAYAAELNHFIDVVLGKVTSEVNGEDGERALVLADAALRALSTGQKQRI